MQVATAPLLQRAEALAPALGAEGQRLQQQAERNKDHAARCTVFASAAERFRLATQHALSAEDAADAAFGLVRARIAAPALLASAQRIGTARAGASPSGG